MVGDWEKIVVPIIQVKVVKLKKPFPFFGEAVVSISASYCLSHSLGRKIDMR
jgi:hypothetical protein